MADYYSLLSRAIAALPQSAPEARQAVYERARKALFNQLRGIQPAVAEEDIEAEGRALDEAIARLELEVVRASSADKAVKRAEPPKAAAEAAPAKPAAPSPKPAAPIPKPAAPSPKPATSSPKPAPLPPTANPASPSPAPKAGPAATEPTPAAPVDARPVFGAELDRIAASEAAAAPEPPYQPQRPAAPLPAPPEPASNSRRILVIAAVLLVVAGIVAVMALQLRESPEDLARLKPEPSASTEATEGGKIVDRVGGDGGEPSAPPPGVRSAAPDAGKSAVTVAQKAELWVSAPEEASKVKTYPGTVIWRLDSMSAGPGQPLASAIRGDIDIPAARLKLALVFQKNLDPTLSASHTINVSFQVAAGSDVKGVKAIGPIQMRRAEAQSGEQVAGIPVPITENNFLIGLLRGNRESRNLTLLRSPMIVDLPMQLSDGRAATISLEKGPGGERVFIDALDSWAQR